jgi:formamidopyrimidine-DNA glycosylase
MPELPDVELYRHALRSRVVDRVLERVRLASPFLLRSVHPSIAAVEGKRVLDVRRLGKRVVFVLEEDLYIVLHLMIAGRLRWKSPGQKIPGRMGLCAFDFDKLCMCATAKMPSSSMSPAESNRWRSTRPAFETRWSSGTIR